MLEHKLRELHETCGFVVNVNQLTDSGSLLVEFPANCLVKPVLLHEMIYYSITKNGFGKNINGINSIPVLLKCPLYAIRPAIIEDIILTCTKRNISTNLINAYDSKSKLLPYGSDIADLLPSPTDSVILQQEKSLFGILRGIIDGRDCGSVANAADVMDGYKFLLGIFSVGGV